MADSDGVDSKMALKPRKIAQIRLNDAQFSSYNVQRALDNIVNTMNAALADLYANAGSLGGSGGSAGDWTAETPSGAVNGSNAVYTLTASPSDPEALILTVNGLLQYQPGDYSVSGTTITMTYAPATGSTLFAQYPT